MADYGMTRNGSGYWDETPVQQDEVKGALPLSTLPEGFHPSGLPFCDQRVNTESGEYAHGSTSAQKQAREHNSNVAPDGRIKGAKPPDAEVNPNVMQDGRKTNRRFQAREYTSNVAPDGRINQAKPAGLPFCDQRTNTESGEYAHGSTVNDPNVSDAENPLNVAPDGRINQAKPAKEYLMQISKLDELISNKRWELSQLRASAEGMAAHGNDVTIKGEKHVLDKVQSSGNPQRMADAVCNMVDVEQRIQADIARWQAEKQRIITTIQPLPEVEYKLLHRRYVKGIPLKDIAEEFERTYSWATTVHGIALKRVQDVLDKRRTKDPEKKEG